MYFLKQTFNMNESHIQSFLTHFPFISYNDTHFERYRFLVQTGLLRYPLLRWRRYKAMDVTLKYAWFLKIGNVVLYEERTILIVSKFQYMQCIGDRPIKLKPISRSISSEWYTIFVSYNFIV